MNVLVLNGSPRSNGNTVSMITAFGNEAVRSGHRVEVIDVCRKRINGCQGCEHCHTKGHGICRQQDDMSEVYEALSRAEVIMIASPVYYFSFSGQLQCAINRMYAVGKPKNLKKSILVLSSGSDDVFDGAVYEYEKTFVEYMGLESVGILTAYGKQNKTEEVLEKARSLAQKV